MGFWRYLFGRSEEQSVKFDTRPNRKHQGLWQDNDSAPDTQNFWPVYSMEELRQRFSMLYRQNFPQYTILEDVPARQLRVDCHPACTPVQFLFCRGEQPVLAVVLVRANTYRGKNVMGTKDLCEQKGIGYLRFFVEKPNEPAYIIERTRQHLAWAGRENVCLPQG